MAEPAGCRRRRRRRGWHRRPLGALCGARWSIARPAPVLPPLRRPHAERRPSSPHRRRRVPATVPLSSLELQHRRAPRRKHQRDVIALRSRDRYRSVHCAIRKSHTQYTTLQKNKTINGQQTQCALETLIFYCFMGYKRALTYYFRPVCRK